MKNKTVQKLKICSAFFLLTLPVLTWVRYGFNPKYKMQCSPLKTVSYIKMPHVTCCHIYLKWTFNFAQISYFRI